MQPAFAIAIELTYEYFRMYGATATCPWHGQASVGPMRLPDSHLTER